MTDVARNFGSLSLARLGALAHRVCSEPEDSGALEELEKALAQRESLPVRLASQHEPFQKIVDEIRQGKTPAQGALPPTPIPAGFEIGSVERGGEFDFLFLDLKSAEELAELASSGLSVYFVSISFSPESFPRVSGLRGIAWSGAETDLQLPALEQLILIEPKLANLPVPHNPEQLINLRVEGAGDIALEFSPFKNLQYLSLTGCKSTGSPPDLLSQANLRSVDLSSTGLTALGDVQLFPQSLTHLDLANNELEALPRWMATLSELEVLNLENNKFQSLPNLFGALPKLKDLRCSSNPMRPARLPEILVPPSSNKDIEPSSYLPGHLGLLAQSDRILLQGEKESKHLVYEIHGEEERWDIDWLSHETYSPFQEEKEPERYKIWRLDETRAVLFSKTSASEVYLCDLKAKRAQTIFTTEASEPKFHILEPGIAAVYDSNICALLGSTGQISKSSIANCKIACCGDRLYRLFSNGELTAYTHKNNKLIKTGFFDKAQFSLETARWYEQAPDHITATELVVGPDSPHIWGKFGDRLLAVWEKKGGACIFAGTV